MTEFEKIILPLLDDNITLDDVSEKTGFVDCYTSDPDRPSPFDEFFIVYDDSIRTNESIERARKFELCGKLKRKYVKYVNNIPLLIYSFWIPPTLKHMYGGVFTLTTEQKAEILQFWGPSDSVVDSVLSNRILSFSANHPMPLADYQKSVLDVCKGI